MPSEPDRLQDLEARLSEARARIAPEPREVAARAMGGGFRLALELVTGSLVGGFIGWLLDRAVHTKPLFLIVFFLLGLAAGFRNLMRAVNREQAAVDAEARDANRD
jgi:ATP synthase protein I